MGINTDGIFNPNGTLSRAEFGTILSRVLFGSIYDGGTPYYAAHLNALNQAGLMNDLSAPERSIMRGDAMLLLFRASTADLSGVTPGFCNDIETVFACTIDPDGSMGLCPAACLGEEVEEGEDPIFAGVGQLTVGLDSSSPNAMTIPGSAAGVKVASFKVQAGDNDVRVDSIKLKRYGFSDSDTLESISLGGMFRTNPRDESSNGEVTLSIKGGLVVKAGGSETVNVLVEVGSATGAA